MYRYLKRKMFETMFHHPQQEAKRYYYQKRETSEWTLFMDQGFMTNRTKFFYYQKNQPQQFSEIISDDLSQNVINVCNKCEKSFLKNRGLQHL